MTALGTLTALFVSGNVRQVVAANSTSTSLLGAIDGVSNGLQITTDTSNNQNYIFHNGSTQTFKVDQNGRVQVGNSLPSGGLGTLNLRTHPSKDSYVKFRDISDFDGALTAGGLAIDCRDSTNANNRHMLIRANELRVWLGATGADTLRFKSDELIPVTDNTYDLGDPSHRFANVYSGDIHLNNTGGGGNEVDGSEGSWTMQEGADDLFLINRITGKKYKFNLTEVT